MKSVLVVDDEQSFVLALDLALTRAGYRVLKASNGEEALLGIREWKPDLVLLDIMMPGLGGLETLKVLKSHPDFKQMPVILMSGARPLARQSDYGWSEFMHKPFTTDQLVKVIEKYI